MSFLLYRGPMPRLYNLFPFSAFAISYDLLQSYVYVLQCFVWLLLLTVPCSLCSCYFVRVFFNLLFMSLITCFSSLLCVGNFFFGPYPMHESNHCRCILTTLSN